MEMSESVWWEAYPSSLAPIPASGVPDGWRECDGENGTPDLRPERWMMKEAEHSVSYYSKKMEEVSGG